MTEQEIKDMVTNMVSFALDQSKQQFDQQLAEAKTVFYTQGFNDGSVAGYVTAMNNVKGALSEGLKLGSPKCGSAMNSLRGMGLADDNDGEE